jgi:hypothetical protein
MQVLEVDQQVAWRVVCDWRLRPAQEPVSWGHHTPSEAEGGAADVKASASVPSSCVPVCKHSAWQSFLPEITGLLCQRLAFCSCIRSLYAKHEARGQSLNRTVSKQSLSLLHLVVFTRWRLRHSFHYAQAFSLHPLEVYNLAMKICSHWELGRKIMFLAQQQF